MHKEGGAQAHSNVVQQSGSNRNRACRDVVQIPTDLKAVVVSRARYGRVRATDGSIMFEKHDGKTK